MSEIIIRNSKDKNQLISPTFNPKHEDWYKAMSKNSKRKGSLHIVKGMIPKRISGSYGSNQ